MALNGQINRPEFGLFDPDYQGKRFYQLFFSTCSLIVLIFYFSYTYALLIALVKFRGLALLRNGFLALNELALGYYSILLLYNVARGYQQIKAPLTPKITKDQIGTENVPFVSILVPMYKEPANVVKYTLLAALDMNYPKNRYEVVVAEDGPSDDSVKRVCEELGVKYVSRVKRDGFKAGAVNNVLPKLLGEYVLFIDADHILEKNVIYNCLLAWRENTIAVQSRIDFVNTPNLLTSVSAYLQIQFFNLYQRARRSTGSAIFAGGSALFDTKKLIDSGGFNPLTIADDTDTSFILRAQGHRIEYIDTIGGWALIPWDPVHMIRQIWRWMTGITKSFTARTKMIFTSDTPLIVKIDHFSVAIFPTVSMTLWFSLYIRIYALLTSESILIVPPMFGIAILGIIPFYIPFVAIYAGIHAVITDIKAISFKQKNLKDQLTAVAGFYILMFAGQPFLIGAIFKGLTRINVAFNRTPKEKKSNDVGLTKIMRQYFIYSVFLAILGFFGCLGLYLNFPIDLGILTLMALSITMLIPLIISFLWYWRLEGYLEEVEGISAINYIGS